MDIDIRTFQQAQEEAEQQLELARDQLQQAERHLTDRHMLMVEIDREILESNREREANLDSPARLATLRTKRRKLMQKKEDMAEEMELLERRAQECRRNVKLREAAFHIAKRRRVQAEGAQVSEFIRSTITTLAAQFHQWQELAREDEVSKNTLLNSRDIRPPDDTPTFSWATITDGTFQQAIGEVIKEGQRADRDAERRQAVLAVAQSAAEQPVA